MTQLDYCGVAQALHSQQIALQFGVAVLAGPQIERSRSEFVDHWLGAAVFREVDGLEVCLAGIATFHANVVEVAGRKDREILVVLLAASGTYDSAKLPFGKAERADHRSRTAIPHLA